MKGKGDTILILKGFVPLSAGVVHSNKQFCCSQRLQIGHLVQMVWSE